MERSDEEVGAQEFPRRSAWQGGLVRSDAKQLANQENGRKGGLAKSRRKTLACRRNAGLPRLGRRKTSRPQSP